MKRKDVVLLSTADWDNPFWTNKQHVAVELARLGYRVLYIDSLGLRRPSASAQDRIRIVKRLWKAARPPIKVQHNIWVWSPIVLPWHSNAAVRRFNRIVLSSGLWLWSRMLGFKSPWLWTYNPLTTAFLKLDSFSCRIYHCVDEIKAQPGMPSALLVKFEEVLSRQVDLIFTTSPALTKTRMQWNEHTHYLPNVADFEHFSRARLAETMLPDDLVNIPSPRLGFIGAISGYKLDFELIRHVATSRPDWSLVLIGQIGEGDPWTNSSLLAHLPNVYLLGPRSYRVLPNYLKGFDVALLPNMLNEYTDSMFPMKFFEYLGAGCPVVSTNLKAIRAYADYVLLAENADDFIRAVERVLAGEGATLAARIELASQFTYSARTRKMLDLITERCSG